MSPLIRCCVVTDKVTIGVAPKYSPCENNTTNPTKTSLLLLSHQLFSNYTNTVESIFHVLCIKLRVKTWMDTLKDARY